VTESKFAFLFILKPQSDGLFEILICESFVQEAVDEHHTNSEDPSSTSWWWHVGYDGIQNKQQK
jgi:hypothetical protein